MTGAGLATAVETVVVGAGFAGVATALALRRAGRRSFVVLERGESVGGTWRDNTYPGVACDVPSHLYHLEGHPHPDWSAVFAPGAEIHDYLERVVREEGLDEHLRLGTTMTRARWTGGHWRVETDHGIVVARHLVLACGRLTEPAVPEVAGLASFTGPQFHSARWDHDVPLAGARVAVVGTGASAVQIVPELVGVGADVTVFQRTPAWIVPRGNRPYAAAEREAWAADPAALQRLRDELYDEGEARLASRSGDAAAAAAARDLALTHLAGQVRDPVLREQLTPAYAFGCKRVLLSDDFYPVIASGAAHLEPSGLASVEGSTLVAASGARHDADIVVLATGFASTVQPYAALVEGEGGTTLDEHWSTGMTSVASTLVTGFPNLFVLGGPNAALGHNSAVLLLEAQAAFAARVVSLARGEVRVQPAAEASYTQEIERRSAGTPWLTGGCRNWYVDERSGRLTLLWPGSVQDFRDGLDRVEVALLGEQAS